MPRKPAQTAAFHQLGQTLRSLETDLRWGLNGSVRIPQAWHEIAQEAIVPAKEKITLRLDSDVLQFFRSMGRGHYSRVNAVLRAFMLARLAEVVKASPDYDPSDEEKMRQVKAEVFAVIKAQEAAREAATAAVMTAKSSADRLHAALTLRDTRLSELK